MGNTGTTAQTGKTYGGQQVHDVVGIGIGPFNLGLAALLQKAPEIDAVFFERKAQFGWHSGMLIDGTTLQVPFFADLVTMADPTHPLSFLNYLHEQGRLYHFYFLEKFHIPRREYDHYCRWASERLPSCRFGCEVTDVRRVIPAPGGEAESLLEVEVYDHNTGTAQTVFTRHLVLGVGSVPSVPAALRPMLGENVFHSADFLSQRHRLREARSVTVIGSGQSAAEVFLELLKEQEACGYRLDWFTRSSGFFPMEYSKLGLEHFSPDYTRYFYGLPQAKRDEIRSRQGLLYKGISAQTIADVYDALYEASVGGAQPDVRLLANAEVEAMEPAGSGYRLHCRHREQGTAFSHESDMVVLATGYAHPVPRFLKSLSDIIAWDEEGRYGVEADYSLTLTQELGSRIYVQNGELHTHGIGAPDLGLGAYRSSAIVNALAGREVYRLQERTVFQQFGVSAEAVGTAGTDRGLEKTGNAAARSDQTAQAAAGTASAERSTDVLLAGAAAGGTGAL
ncbi:lysine N(6)-hydroxylase/L-ornithine N(5)-oxygenase family protein [Paenibacillus caseinilyticus]|uniref:lysine N(6)-hydroxylase/L-ornithine N(5)-oxygenase family protein n=1 Tax=Paenibacillus caseinilyticus TaxID=3098138 RepID=UPI0022B90B46|nr:lysine N(6)-hydroxylase/L-ornithine N(5)-oxygenase family protein [Paenibacillus caseinilyticus]MCZ8519909.1 lysine N(6)-hydroxylase/L-ornithine N(5)-oxygenase family protein [Paenibacillus caseinilyticus]